MFRDYASSCAFSILIIKYIKAKQIYQEDTTCYKPSHLESASELSANICFLIYRAERVTLQTQSSTATQRDARIGTRHFSHIKWDILMLRFSDNYSIYSLILEANPTKKVPASVAQLDAPSDWRPGGRGFNPRRSRQHSFVEIDHEIFSTVILSLPLIQEGQLSVSGERMCTILVNRLED